MKEKIYSYFEAQQATKALLSIKELNTQQYFEGLSDIINNLSDKVADIAEQAAMLMPGTDPLSLVIGEELQNMRHYLIKDMVEGSLTDFLLVQYFTEVCELTQSPLDTELFVLKEQLEKIKF